TPSAGLGGALLVGRSGGGAEVAWWEERTKAPASKANDVANSRRGSERTTGMGLPSGGIYPPQATPPRRTLPSDRNPPGAPALSYFQSVTGWPSPSLRERRDLGV